MATLGVGACGSTSPNAPRVVRSEPLPVSENQQGHREPPIDTAGGEPDTAAIDTPLTEEASIAGVYLWCQSPSGRACRQASAALGTNPKAVEGIPPSLWNVEDRTNDCEEPTIASVSGRLDHAFSVPPSGWRDQSGSMLDVSMLSDMYSAAGCINDADPSHPIAKISAAAEASPRLYLVRVWDGQTPAY